MNTIRIAKIKPNYTHNEGNYPSFLGNGVKTIKETAVEYIEGLFAEGITINGAVQEYLSLSEIIIYIDVNEQTTYNIVFNSAYLEVTISGQKYYYFVDNVSWKNDKLLNLNCQLDYWLTYWKELEWNPNGSCFISRSLVNRYQIRTLGVDKYVIPTFSLDNQIHNQDSHFNFQNHVIQSLNNLSIETTASNTPQFVNQLDDNAVNNDLFKTFGVDYGADPQARVNMMYYAFIAPNAKTNFTFEDSIIKQGVLPSGCYLVPIVTDDDPILSDNSAIVKSGTYALSDNLYSKIANLGNGYVVSIVALPLALHYWCLVEGSPKTYFDFEEITLPSSADNVKLFVIPSRYNVLSLYSLITTDLQGRFRGKYVFPLEEVKYQNKIVELNETKLLSTEFTQFFLNISNKRIPLDNFNVLNFLKKMDQQIYFEPYLAFSLAPHLYNQIIKIPSNYLINNPNNVFNSLNLSENGLFFQQDLQLISTSNAYNTFLTNHKNSYNVSLAQGKIGIANAVPHGLAGLWGAVTNPAGAALKMASAVENYKGVQAVSKDYKREASTINDGNTSDTYGFLTNQNFNYLASVQGYQNLNVYGFISIYQIPFNQLRIINNFYQLHGYLIDNLVNISHETFFQTRMYFDYFEIKNVSTNLLKTNGFNLEVLNWFNQTFNQGVRLWHYTKPKKVFQSAEINNYQYQNWEINFKSHPSELTFKKHRELNNVTVYDIINLKGDTILIGNIGGEVRGYYWIKKQIFIRKIFHQTYTPRELIKNNDYIFISIRDGLNNTFYYENENFRVTQLFIYSGFLNNDHGVWVNSFRDIGLLDALAYDTSTRIDGFTDDDYVIKALYQESTLIIRKNIFWAFFNGHYVLYSADDSFNNSIILLNTDEVTIPILLRDDNNTLYIVNGSYVWRKIQDETRFTSWLSSPHEIISLELQNEILWIGTIQGLYKYSGDINNLDYIMGIPPSYQMNIFIDSLDNVWVSTMTSALYPNPQLWLKLVTSDDFILQPQVDTKIYKIIEINKEVYFISKYESGSLGLWSAVLPS